MARMLMGELRDRLKVMAENTNDWGDDPRRVREEFRAKYELYLKDQKLATAIKLWNAVHDEPMLPNGTWQFSGGVAGGAPIFLGYRGEQRGR
jgi:hypothetical protein